MSNVFVLAAACSETISPMTVLQTGTEVSSLCLIDLFRTNFIQLHHVCMSTPQTLYVYVHVCTICGLC